MVWDALDRTSFEDGRVLRTLPMNNIVEAFYYLAPNYWQTAGDLAIGAGDRFLQRLAAPASDNLFLINDRGVSNLPVWGSLDNLLLAPEDLTAVSSGSSFVSCSILVRRPHRRQEVDYRRNTVNTWVQVGESNFRYVDPMVVVNTFPANNDVMEVRYDARNELVELYCSATTELTLVAIQPVSATNAESISSYFPRNDVIGLDDTSKQQVRTIEITATGLAANSVGFSLLDTSGFSRSDFFGDSPVYLYVGLFFRY